MKMLKNKLAMAILSGVIMVGGAAAMTSTTYAAEHHRPHGHMMSMEMRIESHHGHHGHHRMIPRDNSFDVLNTAEYFAQEFGVKRADVVDYIYAGGDYRNLYHACMLSKLSGKDLKEVFTMRQARDWRTVAHDLGVTRDDMHKLMKEKRENMQKYFGGHGGHRK